MKTIISVTSGPKKGKTKSIILAAKKMEATGAKFIKGNNKWRVEILNIYEITTRKGTFYVAYISKGDSAEEIEEAFNFLDKMIAEKKGSTSNSTFMVDVIVIACHYDGRKKSSLSVIERYAKKNGYDMLITSPFIIKAKPTKYANDFENCIAEANNASASHINSLVYKHF